MWKLCWIRQCQKVCRLLNFESLTEEKSLIISIFLFKIDENSKSSLLNGKFQTFNIFCLPYVYQKLSLTQKEHWVKVSLLRLGLLPHISNHSSLFPTGFYACSNCNSPKLLFISAILFNSSFLDNDLNTSLEKVESDFSLCQVVETG